MSLFLVVIAIPNFVLSFTDMMAPVARVANIVFPLGVYWILLSLTRRVAVSIWAMFPLIFFDAFQIVLLYLYGRSVIAVDMFLNLVTTNPGEAFELLDNIFIGVVLVVVIYVPFLVWATWMLIKGDSRVSERWLRHNRMAAAAVTATGALLIAVCYIAPGDFRFFRDIYPANIGYNLAQAVDRTARFESYDDNVKSFRFGARTTRDSSLREIYVLVIGETARADNWQLAGYERPTNPALSRRQGVIFFDHVLSSSNTTHKSVPMLLSAVMPDDYDAIYRQRGIISAFREAGFATAFFSNQKRNHSFIDHMGLEADTAVFIKEHPQYLAQGEPHDIALVDLIRQTVARGRRKQLIVLHTYGSHFNYAGRYSDAYRRFTPDVASVADAANRPLLINAYDNTIVATDAMLDAVIAAIDSVPGAIASMIYTSDHGEDIFDDGRRLFLHASPCPTFYQLHVPFVAWTSEAFDRAFPQLRAAMLGNRHRDISSSESFFHTALSIAGITARCSRNDLSVASGSFKSRPFRYVNDHNEGVPLSRCGFDSEDFNLLKSHSFSWN